MNYKLFLNLAARNRGFVLPLVLGIGLMVILVGTAMVVRSQSDRDRVRAQHSTVEGIGAAEVGVSRFQNLLNDNRYLALYSDCLSGRDASGTCQDINDPTKMSWANATSVPQLTACDTTDATQVKAVATSQGWVSVDPDNPDKGEYRLIAYNFTSNATNEAPGTGSLVVEGRVKSSNELKSGQSRLSVTIPVEPGPLQDVNIPGVWLVSGGTGGNTVQGDVLLGDCSAVLSDVNVVGTDPVTNEPYTAQHTNLLFPDLPEIPATAKPLGAVTSKSLVLPDSGDTPVTETIGSTTQDVYQYVVDSIDMTGGGTLTITPGKKVRIYLKGNIAKGSMEHSCTDASGNAIAGCRPTDFQIFGYGPLGSSICTIGNKLVEAFILAPNYTVGTAGTGGGQGGIKGTVWAYDWSNGKSCGSNTNNTAVVETASWDEIGLTPKRLPPEIAPLSAWERQER